MSFSYSRNTFIIGLFLVIIGCFWKNIGSLHIYFELVKWCSFNIGTVWNQPSFLLYGICIDVDLLPI